MPTQRAAIVYGLLAGFLFAQPGNSQQTESTKNAGPFAAPKPAVDLKPGTHRYEARLSLGDRNLTLKATTTIQDQGGEWLVTETADGPMGGATEKTTIEKGTLIVHKRSIREGPATVELEHSAGKLTGKMTLNDKEQTVDAKLQGELFADGAGAFDSIGCLPLAEGYTATYSNFNLLANKEKRLQLRVTGSETISVPAGRFETFRIELTSADGGNDRATLWIAKDTRIPVKVSALMAEMGGATMISELQQ